VNKKIHIMVGQKIRELRVKRSLTIEELAFRANLHPSYLGDLERGKRNPSLRNIARIADALNIDISGIFQNKKDIYISNRQNEKGFIGERIGLYLHKISKSQNAANMKLILKIVKDISDYLLSQRKSCRK